MPWYLIWHKKISPWVPRSSGRGTWPWTRRCWFSFQLLHTAKCSSDCLRSTWDGAKRTTSSTNKRIVTSRPPWSPMQPWLHVDVHMNVTIRSGDYRQTSLIQIHITHVDCLNILSWSLTKLWKSEQLVHCYTNWVKPILFLLTQLLERASSTGTWHWSPMVPSGPTGPHTPLQICHYECFFIIKRNLHPLASSSLLHRKRMKVG